MDNSKWAGIKGNLDGATKQRLQGLEDLQAVLSNGTQLSRDQLHDLIDVAAELFTDNNPKVQQGALVALTSLVNQDSQALQPYVNVLVPLVVERLGDARQPVRQEACGLLLSMLGSLPVAPIMERMARFWSHRAWKVRHGLLQTMAEAVSMQLGSLLTNSDLTRHIVTAAVNLLEDRNETVRDAAQDCLQELYRVLGSTLLDSLQQQSIRPAVFRDLIVRLNEVAPTDIALPEPSTSGPATMTRTASQPDAAAETTSAPPAQRTASKRAAAPPPAVAAAAPEPAAPAAVCVASERELQGELQAMVAPLSGTTFDWQQRINYMQRLQALALGCPAHLHEALLENLKPLKDPLTKQVEDRRSAVEKQACQLLACLSAVLGLRFQDFLLHFFPVLIKVLPITVQVMAEAADTCCQALLSTCPTPKLVTLLTHYVTKDKSAKIRACCTSYLAQALQQWDAAVCQRCVDDFEAAMQAACQDAGGEARAAARTMYAAYCVALPDAARYFTSRTQPALLDKLQAVASRSTSRSGAAPARPAIQRPISAPSASSLSTDPDILIVAPARPNISNSGSAAGATPAPAARAAAAPSRVVSAGGAMDGPPLPERRPAGSRKSMAAPGRVLGQESSGWDLAAQHTAPGAEQAGSRAQASRVQRTPSVPHHYNHHAGSSSGTAQRVPSATPLVTSPPRTYSLEGAWGGEDTQQLHTQPSGAALSTGGWPHSMSGRQAGPGSVSGASVASSSRPQSIGKVVAALMAGQKPWNEKVELLTALSEGLRGASPRGDPMRESHQSVRSATTADPLARELERVAHKLLESIDEPHVKVVIAALAALLDCMIVCPHVMEPHIERALPLLFARALDQKDIVRAAASRVLAEVARLYNADVLLLGLVRALDGHKQPRTKQAVLVYATQNLGVGAPAGCPSPQLLKQWLRLVSGLVNDKTPDLRRCACDAIRAAHDRVDAASVQAYIRHSSGIEGAALRRLLPDIDGSHAPLAAESSAASMSSRAGRAADHPGTHGPVSRGSTVLPASRPSQAAGNTNNNIMSAPTSSGALQSNGSLDAYSGVARSQSCHSTVDSVGAAMGGLHLQGTQPAARPGVSQQQQQQQQRQYAPQDYTSPARVAPIMPKQQAMDYSSRQPSSIDTLHASQVAQAADSSYASGVRGVIPPLTTTGGYTSNGAHHTASCVNEYSSAPLSTSSGNLQGHTTVNGTFPSSISSGALSSSSGVTGVGAAGTAAAPVISVPADLAGQTRLLNLLIMRITGICPVEPLLQLKDICVPQVLPGAWTAVGAQLVQVLCSQVLACPDVDRRAAEVGVALVRALALSHPILLMSQSNTQQLLQGLMLCAAASSTQVTKATFEALDSVLEVVPLPAALACLHQQLEAAGGAHDSSSGLLLQALCTGIQRVMARMSTEQLVNHMPASLPDLLRWCGEDSQLEVRKAAIYALAQMKLILGESRFDVYEAQLSTCQQHLVVWATHKIREAVA